MLSESHDLPEPFRQGAMGDRRGRHVGIVPWNAFSVGRCLWDVGNSPPWSSGSFLSLAQASNSELADSADCGGDLWSDARPRCGLSVELEELYRRAAADMVRHVVVFFSVGGDFLGLGKALGRASGRQVCSDTSIHGSGIALFSRLRDADHRIRVLP